MTERGQAGSTERASHAGRGQGRREQKQAGAHAGAPANTLEALERARQHGRCAVAEALHALHALVDAGSLATTGVPAEAQRGLALWARTLRDMAAAFGEGDGASLLGAVADALDAEIDRWEQRAAEDPDARAVLRAYLGLRELLWEFGVRRAAPAEPTADKPNAARGNGLRRRSAIQRVPLEG